MRSTTTARVTYARLISTVLLVWLSLVAPAVSFATSFADHSPRCCRSHHTGGFAGLFARDSCCCRTASSHSSKPTIHSRSECGSACGIAVNGVASFTDFTAAAPALLPAAPAASEALAPARWSAPASQILALRRHPLSPKSKQTRNSLRRSMCRPASRFGARARLGVQRCLFVGRGWLCECTSKRILFLHTRAGGTAVRLNGSAGDCVTCFIRNVSAGASDRSGDGAGNCSRRATPPD
jgi:hypothetical protein